jgi:hypothetical protein
VRSASRTHRTSISNTARNVPTTWGDVHHIGPDQHRRISLCLCVSRPRWGRLTPHVSRMCHGYPSPDHPGDHEPGGPGPPARPGRPNGRSGSFAVHTVFGSVEGVSDGNPNSGLQNSKSRGLHAGRHGEPYPVPSGRHIDGVAWQRVVWDDLDVHRPPSRLRRSRSTRVSRRSTSRQGRHSEAKRRDLRLPGLRGWPVIPNPGREEFPVARPVGRLMLDTSVGHRGHPVVDGPTWPSTRFLRSWPASHLHQPRGVERVAVAPPRRVCQAQRHAGRIWGI